MPHQTIVATDETIHQIVAEEIAKYGDTADLNHIDVAQVTNMKYLFGSSSFNGDISEWDVSNVKTMFGMFNRSALPPLLKVHSIAEYAKKLESMSGLSITKAWFYARYNSTVAVASDHGVALLLVSQLVVPDVAPEDIHPELTQEDACKIQMLYELTGSVYQSVIAWEQQRHTTTLTSREFIPCL